MIKDSRKHNPTSATSIKTKREIERNHVLPFLSIAVLTFEKEFLARQFSKFVCQFIHGEVKCYCGCHLRRWKFSVNNVENKKRVCLEIVKKSI